MRSERREWEGSIGEEKGKERRGNEMERVNLSLRNLAFATAKQSEGRRCNCSNILRQLFLTF